MSKILLIISFSSILFGSGLEGTDFVPRTVNFIIFSAIVYYLVADKIKNMLNGRKEEIQKQLTQAQEKLANSKKQKMQASSKIQESEKMALEIIKTANDECKNIAKQYSKQTEQALSSMKKSYKDRMELDARRVKIEVAKEVLDEFMSNSLDSISQEQIINIINKKVA